MLPGSTHRRPRRERSKLLDTMSRNPTRSGFGRIQGTLRPSWTAVRVQRSTPPPDAAVTAAARTQSEAVMRCHRVRSLLLVALAGMATLWVPSAAAQDSVRVLRFQPDSAASPVAPVVITFDRPVAPKLDESIPPDSLVSIVPAKAHRTYWRDPSTLVAEFDSLWAPGSSYEVRLARDLRSAAGRPFRRRAPWRVRVQQPRLIEIAPIGAVHEETRDANASAHVNLVFSGAVTASQLAGRL